MADRTEPADHAEQPGQPEPPRFPEGDAVSVFGLKQYARAGLTRDEATRWVEAGIRPYQAEAFRRAGFDFARARQATDLKMTGRFVEDAVARGEDPFESWERRHADEAAAAALVAELVDLPTIYGVTLGDVADLAQRADAQVSRWQHESGFPPKRDDGFAVDEVVAFLRRRLKEVDQRKLEGRLDPAWAWGVVVRSLDDFPGARSVVSTAIVLAAAAQGRLALPDGPVDAADGARPRRLLPDPDRRPDRRELARLAAAVERIGPRGDVIGDLGGFLDRIDDLDRWRPVRGHPGRGRDLLHRIDLAIEVGLDPAAMLDDAHDALADPAVTTSHALVDVVVRLLGRPRGRERPVRIYDPAIGGGELALTCARRLGQPVLVRGNETDEDTARVGRARFLLRRMDADIVVRDSLTLEAPPGDDPDALADLIVSDLPFSRSRSAIEQWLRHVLAHLAPRGRAVVALPLLPGAIDLVADHVEEVLVLPSKLRPGARGHFGVAVLVTEPVRVHRLVDARELEMTTARRLVRPSRRSSSSFSHGSYADWIARPGDPAWEREMADREWDGLHTDEFLDKLGEVLGHAGDDAERRKAEALLAALGDSAEDAALAAALRTRFGL